MNGGGSNDGHGVGAEPGAGAGGDVDRNGATAAGDDVDMNGAAPGDAAATNPTVALSLAAVGEVGRVALLALESPLPLCIGCKAGAPSTPLVTVSALPHHNAASLAALEYGDHPHHRLVQLATCHAQAASLAAQAAASDETPATGAWVSEPAPETLPPSAVAMPDVSGAALQREAALPALSAASVAACTWPSWLPEPRVEGLLPTALLCAPPRLPTVCTHLYRLGVFRGECKGSSDCKVAHPTPTLCLVLHRFP